MCGWRGLCAAALLLSGCLLKVEGSSDAGSGPEDAGPGPEDAGSGSPDALSGCEEAESCPSMTVVSSIGAGAGRAFPSPHAWEATRQGDLVTRRVFAVTPGAGAFELGETVSGAGGCSGTYVPEEQTAESGDRMTLDGFTGQCQPGDELVGASSGATATYGALLAVGTIEVGELYSDARFTEAVEIEGSTTDADHYLQLTVAEGHRHLGVPGAGVVIDPDAQAHAVSIQDDYTRVAWLEVTDWAGGATNASVDGINIRADQVLVEYALVHDDGHGDLLNSDANGINLELDGMTATVRNSVIYDLARSGVTIHIVDDATLYVENSTVYRCTVEDNSSSSYGCIVVRGAGSTIHVRNSIAAGALDNGLDFNDVEGGTFGTAAANISSDLTAPGEGSLTEVAASSLFQSVTDGAEDLHLREGAAAIGAGLNLSEELGRDIDGEERPAPPDPWDVGADQR